MKTIIYKLLLLGLTFISPFAIQAQSYQSTTFHENIQSLQITKQGAPMSYPVVVHGQEAIEISFDLLQDNQEDLYYRVHLCNADWTLAEAQDYEYLNGFKENPIVNPQFSFNTTIPYIHYRLNLPNQDVALKTSGNYAVEIFNPQNPDSPLATACFSVVNPQVQVQAQVDKIQQKKQYNQQVNVKILYSNYDIQDPATETTLVVVPNNNIQRAKNLHTPGIILSQQLQYNNEAQLRFEGGNEYRRFDISYQHLTGRHVQDVSFHDPYYHVNLFRDLPFWGITDYTYNPDNNGKTLIEVDENDQAHLEADYVFVHFTLDLPEPYLSGTVHLLGGVTATLPHSQTKMIYDFQQKGYIKTLLLKQGMYEYKYFYKDHYTNEFSQINTEGNYWQTENEYLIYFYHRKKSERYHRLIGFTVVSSN